MREREHTYSRSAEIVRAAKTRKRRMARLSTLVIALLFGIFLTGGIVVIAGSNKQPVTEYKYYTSVEIQPGDTLWSIAEEYYVKNHCSDIRDYIKELKQLNNMSSDKLLAGNKIVVSYYSTEYKY